MLIEEKFVCDLQKCKGGCCEEGDAGAPLENEELDRINEVFEIVKPYLSKEGIEAIQSKGRYQYHKEFGWVTPTSKNEMCAFGFRDQKGVIKCGIEQAYDDGKIDWKKPISCHLYPVKIKKTKEYEMVNYEPRETMCNPACQLGKKLKVPAYVFLKDALIRRYGKDFYEMLDQIASRYFTKTNNRKTKD
jgi:Protein of unknown function (DUF3109)